MSDYPEDELAARRARQVKKESAPMSNYEYESRMASEYHRQMTEVDRAPLADRKEAAAEFFRAMKDPDLVAQRVGWLIDGNYGYGAMKAAKRVLAMNARANKVATLTQMTAALEWQCPARMAVAMWKKLSAVEKAALDKAIKAEIKATEGAE